MAEWRVLGYVPDSDEEEEEEEQQQEPINRGNGVSAHSDVLVKSQQSSVSISREDEETVAQSLHHGSASSDRETVDEQDGASSIGHGVLTQRLLPNLEGSVKAGSTGQLRDHEAHLPPTLSNREDEQQSHHVDPMGIYDLPPGSPVADRLQAALSLGLQQVGEFLRIPENQIENILSGSQSSSPLSSLAPSDSDPEEDGQTEVPPAAPLQTVPTGSPKPPSSSPRHDFSPPRRALRERTQIQLHPYALEDARYQQQLKARGLQPVRIAVSQNQHPQNAPRSLEGKDDLFSSSPADDNSAPLTSNGSMQDSLSVRQASFLGSETIRPASPMRTLDNDEDLPDLATIFRNGTQSKMPRFRRSHTAKVIQPKRDEQRNHLAVFNPPEDEWSSHDIPSENLRNFVPPSPPRSGATSASEVDSDARWEASLPKATPGRLPTPLVSSEIQSRKRAMVALSDSSQDLSGSGSDTGSTPSSDDEVARKMKAMKRRLKGVLPASWLKLDLKQQTMREDHPKELHLARKVVDGKGVAKPKPTSRPLTGLAQTSSKSPTNRRLLVFSDDEQSSDEGTGPGRIIDPSHEAETYENDPMDVLEDNRIDAMLVRDRRRPSTSKRKQHNQQRISDSWQNIAEYRNQQDDLHRGLGGGKSRRSKVLRKPHVKRQRRLRPVPQLTVLDAPGFGQSSTMDQPTFLKVATRKAKSRSRHAVQDPRRKFLRLATDHDTQDINHNLEEWQQGNLRPQYERQPLVSKTSSAADRRLLIPHSVAPLNVSNVDDLASPLSTTAQALDALKISTNTTINRILFKQRGMDLHSSRRSNEATPSVPHPPASLAQLYPRTNMRNAVRNRAGLGLLQTTATEPRAAQIEHTPQEDLTTGLSLHMTSNNTSWDQFLRQADQIQFSNRGTELGDQIATTRVLPVQQTRHIRNLTNRKKSRAPQRTPLLVLTEGHRARIIAESSDEEYSTGISDEVNVVSEIMAFLSQEDTSGICYESWPRLWPLLQRWLEVCSRRSSVRTLNENKQALEIFTLCHEPILSNRWPTISDDLIRKIALFFSEAGMIDRFDDQINPQVGLPPFLNAISSTIGLALPVPGVSTFHLFLSMLATRLTQKSVDATTTIEGLLTIKKAKTELQSFVNRLYPNNGRLISQHEAVYQSQLAALWNRCSLYLTLYCYTVEDCRPRLSQFQNLVDFSKSHIKACEAILSTWGVLADFHGRTTETTQFKSLTELSYWIQNMLLGMSLKWSEALSEVEAELNDSTLADFARYVVQKNRSGIETFLRGALATWAMAIESCETQSAAVRLLGGQMLEPTFKKMVETFSDDSALFQHVLDPLDQYLHNHSPKNHPPGSEANSLMIIIFHTLHSTLAQRFKAQEPRAQESSIDRIVNRRLTYNWFLVASALVKTNDKAWDDFLEPAGHYSWERFDNIRLSAQYKILFVSYIIKGCEDIYRNNKFWYLSVWLKALLQPDNLFLFEHELTKAVLKADQYEPMLLNVPFLLPSGVDGAEMTLSSLLHTRTDILRRLTEDLIAASTAYDSQQLDIYALQPAEMTDLLKVITDTMRTSRPSLAQGSTERNRYDVMVCKLAEKMEGHVQLDQWMTEADNPAFGRYSLRKRFGGGHSATGKTIVPKQDVIWFQHICIKAAIQGTAREIAQVLLDVYADINDPSDTEWSQPKMLAMMQQVFPAYLELALTDRGALVAAPLLQSLDAICENMFMRALNIGSEDHSSLLDALYATIVSCRLALQRSHVAGDVARVVRFDLDVEEPPYRQRAPEPPGTRVQAFASVVRIARTAISQYLDIIRSQQLSSTELERVAPHAQFIFVFVNALWRGLREGEEGHWSEFQEEEEAGVGSHALLLEPEANSVRKFTAEALQRTLREDWSRDHAGNWWVMQGRAAVPVVRVEGGGVEEKAVRGRIKREMRAYLDLYEGRTDVAEIDWDAVEENRREMG